MPAGVRVMVRNTIRLVCAAALLSVLLAGGPAVAEQGERSAVIAEGELASRVGSGSFSYRPGVQGTFHAMAGEPLIRLRYRLWTLVGEPVWAFTGRAPRLARIHLQTENNMPLLTIERRPNLPGGTVRWNAAAGLIQVSDDLMDLARIYDFAFLAGLNARSLDQQLPPALRQASPEVVGLLDPISIYEQWQGISIYRAYQGILGQPGEWGWSVPGSPDWGETFTRRKVSSGYSVPFTRDSFKEQLLEPEPAKEAMRRLLHGYQSEGRAPLEGLMVGGFQVDINDLIRSIRKAEPEALHRLNGVHSKYDEQLSAIVEDYADELRRKGLIPALEREGEEIDAVVSRHEQRLSDTLIASWKAIRAEAPIDAANSRAEAQLRELGPAVSEHLSEGRLEFSPDLQQRLDQARAFFAAEPNLGKAMKARWRTLESALEPDAGKNLFAGRLRDNGDGTVTDVVSGLQWTRFMEGQEWRDGRVIGEPNQHKAITTSEEPARSEFPLDHAGHQDWRLPSLEDLSTLIYCPNSNSTDIHFSELLSAAKYARLDNCQFYIDELRNEGRADRLQSEKHSDYLAKAIPAFSMRHARLRMRDFFDIKDISEHFDSVTYGPSIRGYVAKRGCWSFSLHPAGIDYEAAFTGGRVDTLDGYCSGSGYVLWVRDSF